MYESVVNFFMYEFPLSICMKTTASYCVIFELPLPIALLSTICMQTLFLFGYEFSLQRYCFPFISYCPLYTDHYFLYESMKLGFCV